MKHFYLFALMLLFAAGWLWPRRMLLPAGTVASLGLPTVFYKDGD